MIEEMPKGEKKLHNADLHITDFMNMLQLGRVDTGSGTLFGVPQKGAVEKRRLTLVIGTGGSGCAVTQQAFIAINQRLEKGYSEYVKFIVIGSPWSIRAFNEKEVDTLSLYSPLAGVRLSPENRSTFYKRFIPRDFPVHKMEYGRYHRQLSKVRLYDINGGTTNDQLLRDTISDYFMGDWAAHKDLPVDILVVSGLAGSLGSGTFIDIAVRARQACPAPANVTVYGYIMLPDTAERFASTDEAKRGMYRNGFAALKELESYESILLENGRKEFFPAPSDKNNVVIMEPVFDYPVLISGDYNKAINMIAETIVMTVTDNGDVFFHNSFYLQKQRMKDFKLANDKVSRFGILNPDACPEDSHMYSSIGYAQASIPEKIVIPHVIGAVSKKLYRPDTDAAFGAATTYFCTKEKSLNKLDYQNAIRELLGLTLNQELKDSSLWTKLNTSMSNLCMLRENPEEISFDDVLMGNIDQYMKGFGITGTINNATEGMKKVIENEFDSIKVKAQGIMKKYGPRAMQYLYDGTGNPDEHGVNEDYSEFCIKTQIDFVKNRFSDQKAGIMPRRPITEAFTYEAALHLAKIRLIEWKEAVRAYAGMNVRHGVAQNMIGADGIWQTSFVNPMTDFLWCTSRFADVLETLSNYYSGIGKSLDTDDYREFMKQSGEINGINLCRDAGTYAWVKGRISSKLANIKVQAVRDELVDDFYLNNPSWTSNDRGVARKEFDEVMSRVCAVGKYAGSNNGMDLTVTDYFDHVLSTVEPARQKAEVSNAVHDIFGQLMTKSSPCMKVKQGTELICNGTIMLPRSLQAGASGPLISQAFQIELSASGVAMSNLVYSAVVDSIVCYQTSEANALSDLADFGKWENAYEQAIDSTTHLHNGEIPTLHMDTGYSQYNELTMDETIKAAHLTEKREVYPEMAKVPDAEKTLSTIYGTGLSWSDYPSINVTRYGSSFKGNDGTHESNYRRDVFSKKIEEALRLGVIECERTGDVYKYFINLIPRDWTNLNINGYKNRNEKGMFLRGKALFDYLAEQNPESTSVYRKQIYLQGSPFFGPEGFDFSEIKQVENWPQERIDREHKAYMMRMMRKMTSLYQDMEDTLFKLYPVEYYLQVNEEDIVKRGLYRKFFEMYLYGLLNSDEKGLEWTAIVDESGEKERLIKFSKIMLRRLDDLDTKFVLDKFRLYYVYEQYAEIRKEFNLSDEALDKIRGKVNERIDERKLEEQFEERTEKLQDELNLYKEKFGSEDDSVGAIMNAYGIVDNQMRRVKSIVDFYETLSEVLREVL